MFLYPIYAIFIYRHWKWNTKWISYSLCVFILLTIPYQNYFNKLFIIKRTIDIYNYDKIKESHVKYEPLVIQPNTYSDHHVAFPGKHENTKADDMVFRLLVWEDLCAELVSNHAWFGMGLSHPLRSPQIEKLHIAESEWRKDGWISAHNSYLYVIYRAGIIGFLAILWLFFKLYCCDRDFKDHRDITGMVLLGCLGYWLLRANWMLQFEIPYYAIPMWFLVGLIFNHRKRINDNRQRSLSTN